ESTLTVTGTLWRALAAQPALGLEALALGVAAALLPLALARGPWGIAAYGSACLAATLVPAPEISPVPLVLAIWATCGLLAARPYLPALRAALTRHRSTGSAPSSTPA
ncbi:MAG: hypothetical protein H0V40_08455, partial [Actinobacteria bacterium]|nr:hypothetical protein [Actinomycetota bacterium]